eukprot:SAG11_NODE_1037_length_6079_cov_2.278930_3_plen_133_part_00
MAAGGGGVFQGSLRVAKYTTFVRACVTRHHGALEFMERKERERCLHMVSNTARINNVYIRRTCTAACGLRSQLGQPCSNFSHSSRSNGTIRVVKVCANVSHAEQTPCWGQLRSMYSSSMGMFSSHSTVHRNR